MFVFGLYGMILAVGTGFKTTSREETEYFVSRSVPSPSVSVSGEFPVFTFCCFCLCHIFSPAWLTWGLSSVSHLCLPCASLLPALPHLFQMFSPAGLCQFGHVFVCLSRVFGLSLHVMSEVLTFWAALLAGLNSGPNLVCGSTWSKIA